MSHKIFVIAFLLVSLHVVSQNTDNLEIIEENSLASQLYNKCFENLNQGSEILELYPAFKDIKLCSIAYCMQILAYNDKEVKSIGENRLIGIATQLYNEGTPILLIMGLESSLLAEQKNKNLLDDNHIVYISYGECTNPPYLRLAAEIINKQTGRLIQKK